MVIPGPSWRNLPSLASGTSAPTTIWSLSKIPATQALFMLGARTDTSADNGSKPLNTRKLQPSEAATPG